MGFKGLIYVCDICGKKQQNIDFPKDWFNLEIMRGNYTVGTSWSLDQSLCSEECFKKALQNYLDDISFKCSSALDPGTTRYR